VNDPGEYTRPYERATGADSAGPRPRRSPLGPILVAGVVGLLLLAVGFVVGAASAGGDDPEPRGNVTLDRRLQQVTVTESVAKVTVVVTR
jgi:hypothetical protein